mmetsp:Transcript_15198/g.33994  ORF Transcript_15198/g.33994 Transcript_15198/m.33994 type:complete len:137 (-) Transcript_15198:1651-2061(-)
MCACALGVWADHMAGLWGVHAGCRLGDVGSGAPARPAQWPSCRALCSESSVRLRAFCPPSRHPTPVGASPPSNEVSEEESSKVSGTASGEVSGRGERLGEREVSGGVSGDVVGELGGEASGEAAQLAHSTLLVRAI